MTPTTIQLRMQTVGNAIITHRPIMVLAVFTLPLKPAAITLPFPTATKRRPVTANSLVRTSISAQAGNLPHSQNMTNAATTNSLSANGYEINIHYHIHISGAYYKYSFHNILFSTDITVRFLSVNVGFGGFGYYSLGLALFAFVLYLAI